MDISKGDDVRMVRYPSDWSGSFAWWEGRTLRVLRVYDATENGGFLGLPTPASVRVFRGGQYYTIPIDCVERV